MSLTVINLEDSNKNGESPVLNGFSKILQKDVKATVKTLKDDDKKVSN